MKALIGYALLFLAIGLILAYFVSGFLRFCLILLFLVIAYVLLCVC
ncbi:MAG: hypothetical protein J5962_04480 [Lachnospiraceae bacterium]|nr:hypothetical protein [Lachnospiraceae bacterium]